MQRVAADLRSPLNRLLLAPFGGQLLRPRALLLGEELRAQELHRRGLVLGLRALVLALDDDPGWDVGEAHGGVRLVDVLTTRAGGPIGVDSDVLVGDLDGDVAGDEWPDIDLREGGV